MSYLGKTEHFHIFGEFEGQVLAKIVVFILVPNLVCELGVDYIYTNHHIYKLKSKSNAFKTIFYL